MNWGYFIVGLPGETEETTRQTIDFAKKLPLDIALFHVAAPYPGTPFFFEVVREGWVRPGTRWEQVDMDKGTVLDYPDFAIEVTDRCTVALTDQLPVFLRTGVLLLSILPGSLLFAGLAYARKTLRATPVLWLGLLVAALVFPASMFFLSIDDFFYSPDFAEEYLVFLGNAGSWFYAGVMLYCILALVNIEAAFSSITGSSDRWRIKFEVVGISAIIAMLILYFSQGLLYRTINMNLLPLRSAVLIIGSLLIVYSRRVRGTGVRVTVSRYIFYRSLNLLIVGAYLILLSLIGEGMKYFDFGRNITMFFGFVLGILLFILILSEQPRRRAKVFINNHFFAHKRDYREEWLRFTGRLASCKTLVDVYEATLNTFNEDFGLERVSLYVSDTKGSLFRPALSMAMPRSASARMQSGLILTA